MGLFRLQIFVCANRAALVFGVYDIILNPADRVSLYAEGHVLSRIILRRYLTGSLIVLLNPLGIFRLSESRLRLLLWLVHGLKINRRPRTLEQLSE